MVINEVEIGKDVIESGIGKECKEKMDRMVEEVGRKKFRKWLIGKEEIIDGEGMGWIIEIKIGEIIDSVIIIVEDEKKIGKDIGIGEVEIIIKLICDEEMIDEGVVEVGVEEGNEEIKFELKELRIKNEI